MCTFPKWYTLKNKGGEKFETFVLDHWWGFSTLNAHMVHIDNSIRFYKWCIHLSRSLFSYFNYLVSVTAGRSESPPRAHVAKFYDRLRLIRSVLRASKFSVFQMFEIVILWVYYTIPFGFSLFRHFWDNTFQLLKLLRLGKDHWWGFSTRNAHMVHIVNSILF